MKPETELPEAPDAPPTETGEESPAAKIDPAVYDAYAGRYELVPGLILNVTREDDRLMVQPTGQAKAEMVPESETLLPAKLSRSAQLPLSSVIRLTVS